MSDGYIGDIAAPAPDLVGTVIGVRGFARRGHTLASPFQGDEWKTPEMSATCEPTHAATQAALVGLGTKPKVASTAARIAVEKQRRLGNHPAPRQDCACGIYAYYEPDHKFLDKHAIVGVVEAWGTCIPHPTGFRAERVRVVALALADDLTDAVEDQRLAEAARRASAWWKVPLLRLEELELSRFGDPIPVELRPKEEEGEE
jgi:hypothetical protein